MNRHLLASDAPGILDDWYGPVEYLAPNCDAWAWAVALSVTAFRGNPVVTYYALFSDDAGGLIDAAPTSVRLDSTRPEVRDRMARWLAERLDVEVEATAPAWRLRADGWHFGDLVFGTTVQLSEWGRNAMFAQWPPDEHVEELAGLTDPGEALVVCCRAVGRMEEAP